MNIPNMLTILLADLPAGLARSTQEANARENQICSLIAFVVIILIVTAVGVAVGLNISEDEDNEGKSPK